MFCWFVIGRGNRDGGESEEGWKRGGQRKGKGDGRGKEADLIQMGSARTSSSARRASSVA